MLDLRGLRQKLAHFVEGLVYRTDKLMPKVVGHCALIRVIDRPRPVYRARCSGAFRLVSLLSYVGSRFVKHFSEHGIVHSVTSAATESAITSSGADEAARVIDR